MADVTVSDAKTDLANTISFAQIAAQNAPAGHPVFAAIQQAQDTLAWLNQNEGIIPPTLADTPRVAQMVQDAISNVYDATGTITTDPSKALPATIWQTATQAFSSWGWVAGGAALLVGFAWWFQGRRRT